VLPNGRYNIVAYGAATAAIDKLLFAILQTEPPAEEWVITWRQDVASGHQYTLVTNDY
jgi:hypothetical protein